MNVSFDITECKDIALPSVQKKINQKRFLPINPARIPFDKMDFSKVPVLLTGYI